MSILSASKVPDTLPIGQRNLKALAGSGVRIVLSTDTIAGHPKSPPGLTTIQELKHMADAGLTNAQIITAATGNAAEHLGLLDDLGTVVKGKIADLIIMDGDFLTDIAAMEKVQTVIQTGRVVYSDQHTARLQSGLIGKRGKTSRVRLLRLSDARVEQTAGAIKDSVESRMDPAFNSGLCSRILSSFVLFGAWPCTACSLR